jgi:hypothetical protein
MANQIRLMCSHAAETADLDGAKYLNINRLVIRVAGPVDRFIGRTAGINQERKGVSE